MHNDVVVGFNTKELGVIRTSFEEFSGLPAYSDGTIDLNHSFNQVIMGHVIFRRLELVGGNEHLTRSF